MEEMNETNKQGVLLYERFTLFHRPFCYISLAFHFTFEKHSDICQGSMAYMGASNVTNVYNLLFKNITLLYIIKFTTKR